MITTDGTTLLGADDKAGIAEIMTMAAYFLGHPEVKHGTICIGFTPDEEVGRGADGFDVDGFGLMWPTLWMAERWESWNTGRHLKKQNLQIKIMQITCCSIAMVN